MGNNKTLDHNSNCQSAEASGYKSFYEQIIREAEKAIQFHNGKQKISMNPEMGRNLAYRINRTAIQLGLKEDL